MGRGAPPSPSPPPPSAAPPLPGVKTPFLAEKKRLRQLRQGKKSLDFLKVCFLGEKSACGNWPEPRQKLGDEDLGVWERGDKSLDTRGQIPGYEGTNPWIRGPNFSETRT